MGLASRSPVIWALPERRKQVALTFDDGPTPWTARVLDLLKASGVSATFFVLGSQVERFPELVRRMIDEGHDVAIHGYEHTAADFARQVSHCDSVLRRFGISARVVRPPGGKVRFWSLCRLWAKGYRTVLFSFDTHDSMRHEGKWPGPGPDYEEIRDGDIVLMHDDNPVCVAELETVFGVLRGKGLHSVTLGDFLHCAAADNGAGQA